VVSGPNGDGNWDNNGSAEFCEVAVDYNAGITGAVAFLNALESSDGVRLSNGFAVTPTSAVDLDANPVNITATLSKSTPWTVTIQGGAGSKTFSGTGTSIDIDWEGEADEGSFLAGEIVKARLSIEDVISILDLVKATPKSIELAKTKKPAARAADSLVDDFEDQNQPTGTTANGRRSEPEPDLRQHQWVLPRRTNQRSSECQAMSRHSRIPRMPA
jgi:hypothetical protein